MILLSIRWRGLWRSFLGHS